MFAPAIFDLLGRRGHDDGSSSTRHGQIFESANMARPATDGGDEGLCPRNPTRRRRRPRRVATAAAAAAASAAAAAALASYPGASALPLSPAAALSLSPAAAVVVRPLRDAGRGRRRGAPAAPARPPGGVRTRSSALDMVSFLEVPTTTTTAAGTAASSAAPPPARKVRGGRSPPPRATRLATRGVPRSEGGSARKTTVEIDFAEFLDPESGRPSSSSSSSSSPWSDERRAPPQIDSEILYEGIVRPTADAGSVASEVVGAVASIDSDDKSNSKSKSKSKLLDDEARRPATTATAKPPSKSSTMPGFLKDASLDAHVVDVGLRRLPHPERRTKLARKNLNSEAARLRRRRTNSDLLYQKSPAVPDSLREYASEIHKVSRVTPKEERELGTRTQEAMRLVRLQEDLRARHGREPSDDEWCAAAGKVNAVALREAVEEGLAAKNRLVESNLRMVQRVVNLYVRNGLGSEYNAGDLMQDGTVALIRAAEKYEPDRGFRFSTYAMYWIRSAVKRSQTSQSRIVSVPQRVHETHKRVAVRGAALREELGRKPTDAELARACEITTTQLDRCRKAMAQATLSLDVELQNGHKPNDAGGKAGRRDTLYDVVTEGRADETEVERTQRLLMKEHLVETVRRYLAPHEVDLLLLRYGLMDDRALPRGMSGPLTIAEVSNLVKLKPDKVRRIIINSQKQLRHLMKEWEDFESELA
ncbi:hypothetical protein ACHAWF_004524 [Thalassiosira exigua]